MKMKLLPTCLVCLLLTVFAFSCGQQSASEQSTKTSAQSENSNPQSADRVVPVEAMVLKYKNIEENIPVTGILRPIRSVDIVAEVSGKITKIEKSLGEKVIPRDTLAFIDDEIPYNNYRQAKSQVLSAENNLKISELNLRSDKELFRNGDISELAYETSMLNVKTSEASHLSALANFSLLEKNFNDTRIMSPISGLISRKYIELGTMATQNMPLYRVVDLSTLKIDVGIPQSLISRVTIGSRANITISALGDEIFEGSVRYVSPQADENTGAFNTEIHVQNTSDSKIKAGMTAKIDLILSDSSNQLAIPDYALVTKNEGTYVYTVKSSLAKLTNVSVSGSFGSQVFIKGGLSEGDTIVVVGMKNLGVDTKIFIEEVY